MLLFCYQDIILEMAVTNRMWSSFYVLARNHSLSKDQSHPGFMLGECCRQLFSREDKERPSQGNALANEIAGYCPTTVPISTQNEESKVPPCTHPHPRPLVT